MVATIVLGIVAAVCFVRGLNLLIGPCPKVWYDAEYDMWFRGKPLEEEWRRLLRSSLKEVELESALRGYPIDLGLEED